MVNLKYLKWLDLWTLDAFLCLKHNDKFTGDNSTFIWEWLKWFSEWVCECVFHFSFSNNWTHHFTAQFLPVPLRLNKHKLFLIVHQNRHAWWIHVIIITTKRTLWASRVVLLNLVLMLILGIFVHALMGPIRGIFFPRGKITTTTTIKTGGVSQGCILLSHILSHPLYLWQLSSTNWTTGQF